MRSPTTRPRHSRANRAHSATNLFAGMWPIAVLLLGLVLCLYVDGLEQDLRPFALALIVGCVIALLGFSRDGASRAPLAKLAMAPTGFPLAYFGFVLLAPLTLALVSDERTGQISRELLTGTTILISLVTVGGLALGVHAPLRDAPFLEVRIGDRHAGRLVLVGRAILIIALAAVVAELMSSGSVFTSAYGAAQTTYGLSQVLGTVTLACLLVGCTLVLHTHESSGTRLLQGRDLAILVPTLLINTILLGSRAEVIPVVVLYIWYRVKSGRVPSLATMAMLATSFVVVFVLMGRLRTIGQGVSGGAPFSIWKQALAELSTPVVLSHEVAQLVPDVHNYYNGSTYWYALAAMAPGFIRLPMGIEVGETGAFAYRNLIGYSNPNNGFGFAFPTEAYMNFGLPGVMIASILLGLLLRLAYSRSYLRTSVFGYAYPILLATLPYNLRADALTQLKTTVYPLALIAVIVMLTRGRVRGR